MKPLNRDARRERRNPRCCVLDSSKTFYSNMDYGRCRNYGFARLDNDVWICRKHYTGGLENDLWILLAVKIDKAAK